MRWLINYIRQCFCKHDWHFEEAWYEVKGDFIGTKKDEKVYMRCKKCGYHQKHWKG